MNELGHSTIAIAKLKLPGTFAQRMKDPDVAELAKNIEALNGLIHDPVVRKKDKLLLAGQGRVAAFKKLGRDKIPVKYVDCTDDEVERIRKSEDAYRRHSPERQAELIGELVELMAKELAEDPGPKRPGKRPKSPRGRARERIADDRGIKPESVRIAEWREDLRAEAKSRGVTQAQVLKERKAAKPSGNGKVVVEAPVPPVLTMDMELDEAFSIEMRDIQERIDTAARTLAAAASVLTVLVSTSLPIRVEEAHRAKEALQIASHQVRALRPHSLCAACKGIDEVTRQCVTCRKSAYLTKEELSLVPRALLDLENPVVLFQGRLVPRDEFFRTPTDADASPEEDIFDLEEESRPIGHVEPEAIDWEDPEPGDDLFGGME